MRRKETETGTWKASHFKDEQVKYRINCEDKIIR